MVVEHAPGGAQQPVEFVQVGMGVEPQVPGVALEQDRLAGVDGGHVGTGLGGENAGRVSQVPSGSFQPSRMPAKSIGGRRPDGRRRLLSFGPSLCHSSKASAGMRMRRRSKALRNMGLVATVSARALNVDVTALGSMAQLEASSQR